MTTEEESSNPELESKYERVLSIGEECIASDELKAKISYSLSNAKPFRLYDGFEPSGRMHIAQGIFKAMNVNKATESGGTFVFWVADWFALMNDKMGGDLEKIKIVGEYFIQVWKAAGMKGLHTDVNFLWASDEITSQGDKYWPLMLDVGRRFTITRIKKCCQIMGRLEGNLTAAQVLYPLMQCTDVFFLKADICQLGVDQRKVNMLAREYADAAKVRKPVILSHHMLFGLKAGQAKMSKSDPDSAVFMEDTKEDVERKIMAAYCPREGEEDKLNNPCLDYLQYIIFAPLDATFTAAGKTYHNFPSVRDEFFEGTLSEQDLKKGLIEALNVLLEPVRVHFKTDEHAKFVFGKVLEFKKEAKTKSSPNGAFRKLDLVNLEVIPSNSHVVFLPLPVVKPTLQMLYDTLTQIKSSPTNSPVVLFISDWTARVMSSLDAEQKAISAFYNIYLAALKALDCGPVTVIKQSEAILKDSSNYWISVINIGRFFQLDEVMGGDLKDSDGVGNVIARLMKVADTMSLSPALVTFSAIDKSSSVEISLIHKYFSHVHDLTLPKLEEVHVPSLHLIERENEAHKMDTDEYYVLDDPKVHGKSKMKKAFCEPKNTSFCPPIELISVFSSASSITIPRSEANGGDVIYNARSEMEQDFLEGKLHPGDVKNAAAKVMVDVLTKLMEGIKVDADANKATKVIKATEKKLAKKKVQQLK